MSLLPMVKIRELKSSKQKANAVLVSACMSAITDLVEQLADPGEHPALQRIESYLHGLADRDEVERQLEAWNPAALASNHQLLQSLLQAGDTDARLDVIRGLPTAADKATAVIAATALDALDALDDLARQRIAGHLHELGNPATTKEVLMQLNKTDQAAVEADLRTRTAETAVTQAPADRGEHARHDLRAPDVPEGARTPRDVGDRPFMVLIVRCAKVDPGFQGWDRLIGHDGPARLRPAVAPPAPALTAAGRAGRPALTL